MASDLVGFLRGRLSEDEVAAKAAVSDDVPCIAPGGAHVSYQLRVLREVEALRRIVGDYENTVRTCREMNGGALHGPGGGAAGAGKGGFAGAAAASAGGASWAGGAARGYQLIRGGRDAFRAACAILAAVCSDYPDYHLARSAGA